MEVDGAPQQEAGPPNPDPGAAEGNPLQEVGEAAALRDSAQEDTQKDVEGEPQKAASPQDGPVDAAETGSFPAPGQQGARSSWLVYRHAL